VHRLLQVLHLMMMIPRGHGPSSERSWRLVVSANNDAVIGPKASSTADDVFEGDDPAVVSLDHLSAIQRLQAENADLRARLASPSSSASTSTSTSPSGTGTGTHGRVDGQGGQLSSSSDSTVLAQARREIESLTETLTEANERASRTDHLRGELAEMEA